MHPTLLVTPNINMLVASSNRKALLEACEEYGLISNISIPTREAKTSSTSLDIILTSVSYISCTGIVLNNLSDHYPTFLIKKKVQINQEKVCFQSRSY